MIHYLYYSETEAIRKGYIKFLPTDTNYTLINMSPDGCEQLKDKLPDMELVGQIDHFPAMEEQDWSHAVIDYSGYE